MFILSDCIQIVKNYINTVEKECKIEPVHWWVQISLKRDKNRLSTKLDHLMG